MQQPVRQSGNACQLSDTQLPIATFTHQQVLAISHQVYIKKCIFLMCS